MDIISRHRTVLCAAVSVLVAGGAAAVLLGNRPGPVQSPAPPAVQVQIATTRRVTDWAEYSGRLEAVGQVEIRPRVAGTLLGVHFHDGQQVREGDLLYTIDPEPFEVEARRAAAALAQAQDRQRFTALELERGRRLLEANTISRREFDAMENAAREAASVAQAARAAADRARLDVDYTHIRAPITGRISRSEVTAGNVVKAGGDAAPLTSIVTLDPIYASFNVDEHTLLRYLDASKGARPLQVQVGLAGEEGHPHAARLHSLDNQLDTRSGTIRVRAVLDNPDGRMIPGLQARIRLQASEPYPAVLVDEAAIGTDQDRRFVLVVGKDGRVEYRRLELGSRQGGLRVVRSGLAPGDQVIVEGAQRVRPGDAVAAVPAPPREGGPLR